MWSGNAEEGTTYVLNQQYTNFQFIIVALQVNNSTNDFMLIPTTAILSTLKYARFVCGDEGDGQKEFPFLYNSRCTFSFPGTAQFKYESNTYNNRYFKLTPIAIYGIMKKN